MNRKENLLTSLLGILALVFATSASAEDRTPATASIAPASQTLIATVGKPITATTAYQATNFGSSPTYGITPDPKTVGLAFNTSNGVISGTPTAPLSKTVYTVTATSSKAKATATITLTVLGSGSTPPPPSTSSTLNCPDATQAASETAATQGRRAYLRLNCYGCHGDYAQGGTMGPNVQGAGGDVAEAINGDGAVSYTHLTLPTKRIV